MQESPLFWCIGSTAKQRRCRCAHLALAGTLALALCLPVRAAEQLAEGTYLVRGAARPGVQPDGNSIIIEAPQGLIVFDTGRHVEHTRAVLDLATQLQRPIAAIVNSHWHLDHIGGNALLREQFPAVRIYASGALEEALAGFLADYRRQLDQALHAQGTDAAQQAAFRTEMALIDAGPKLAPTDVVSASGVRLIAGRSLDLRLEHAAVTAGDVWVLDPQTQVLLAGDLVTLPVPFLDTACPSRWREALSHLSAAHFRLLVPGHGAPMSAADLQHYRTAFTRLADCGRSTRVKRECIEGWIADAGELVAPTDATYARSLLDYYLDNALRGDRARSTRLCEV